MKFIGIALFIYGFLCLRNVFRDMRNLISFDSYIERQSWLTEKGRDYTKMIMKRGIVLNAAIAIIVFILGYYLIYVW